MTPKKGKPEKPSFDDDEFKFSDDEFGIDESVDQVEEDGKSAAEPQSKKKKKFKISRKSLVWGIVALVAVIAIFQFLTQKEKAAQPELPVAAETTRPVQTLTPPKATLPRTTAATTTTTTTLTPPVVSAPAVIQTPSPTPTTTLTIPQSTTLPVVTQKNLPSPSVQSSSNLTEMSQVSQAIVELRNDFSNLSTQLQTMSTQLQQTICNPNEFCPQTRAMPIVKEKIYRGHRRAHKKAPAPLVYHVKALIPGRAWLESNRGTTTSVKVGDTLKNYGQIISINPNTGMVDTSSGRVIKYGRYDS